MISDIVSVVLTAIVAYFLVYGFYATINDLFRSDEK